MTTHNMEEATALCDTVALLSNGEIVEAGSPKEICLRYDRQRSYHVLLNDGVECTFTRDKHDALASLISQDLVRSIHTSEPNLETVFIEKNERGASVMKEAYAIFIKQLKDTWRNKSILLQFVLLPIMALAMGYIMPEDMISKRDIAAMFTTMYVSMIPIASMCAIIAEEREKGTLRALRMANVNSGQYLIGIGSCLFLESMF